MTWIDDAFQAIGDCVESSMPEGAVRSLLVDGVVAGVGSVIVFLPQILILFLFIAILEDCGYMARAAYLDGQADGARGSERQIVHPAALVVCVCDSRRDGNARDRKPPRSADDDPRGAVDELLGALAGVRAADRRVYSAARIPRRVDSPARADAVCNVPGRHRDGRRRRASAQANAVAWGRRRRS